MSCRLLVKNISNSWSTGDVIAIFDGEHEFASSESKTKFIAAGNNSEDWPRQFVIVNIIDADKRDLLYLLSDIGAVRQFYIQPQGEESPYYNELLNNAEITTDFKTLSSIIVNRED